MSTRVYYRLTLALTSPLSIGAADSGQTDNDILLDSRGEPMIPAGSIAGVLRSYFYDPFAEHDEEKDVDKREDVCKRIFGELDDAGNESSAVRTFDACLKADTPNKTVSVREGVKLREGEKVPESKKKFDRQIVEAGAQFQTCLEIVDTSRCDTDELEGALAALHAGTLRFGSKTTRGYGRVSIVSCKRRSFEFPGDADEWIAFDPTDANDPAWSTGNAKGIKLVDSSCGPRDTVLRLKLRVVGGLSIREYQTEAEGVKYTQLFARGIADKDGERVPVIPGTSWAGALLARCKDPYVVRSYGNHATALFGTVDERTKEQVRSRVTIDESTVRGGTWKAYTRNSIDRFTGGTTDGALYEEESYWGGTTDLVLAIRNVSLLSKNPSQTLSPLIAALADLHNGFLAIGGLTAVGRGVFVIEEKGSEVLACGEDVTDEFFQAFLGKSDAASSDGFARPNVAAVAEILCGDCEAEGGVL